MPPRPARLTRPGFEAADRVAVAGPAPFPVVLLVELKHVDSYHVLSDAAQPRGRRRAAAGVAAGGGRVRVGRRLDGAGERAAGALPRRRAAAPMAQGPQQEAAGQAGGHRGMLRAAGRARSGGGWVAACVWVSRLALPHRGEGAAGPGRRREGGGGPPPPLMPPPPGQSPGPGARSCGPGAGEWGQLPGSGCEGTAGGDAAFLQQGFPAP